MTAACPSSLGAVNPTLAEPSLLTAEPLITARMRSPAASASDSRRNTTTPTPFPFTQPAAAASNARQRPSGEAIPPSS